MKHKVSTSWKGAMQFEADVAGHKLLMDAPAEAGGKNKGPRPKPLMMASLAGCTGMDVVAMLKKMRVELDGFAIHIEGDLTDDPPKHYTKMHVVYEFSGKDLPLKKLEKAVDMSREKYCGVSYSYKKAMEISYEIRIIDTGESS
ncbi:MAG: OsmC family protein [Bacteroidales bacterium]|nr:OsmC family protein [Bacteroidales bacterium]